MRVNFLTGLLGATALLGALSAHAQLVTTDGGLGVYDPTNNVTWTSNANLFASQYSAVNTIIADANSTNGGAGLSSGLVSSSDFNSDGTMDWSGANAWVNYLDVTDYGGSNQWALPTTVDSNSSQGYPNGGTGILNGQNQIPESTSQMAQLFYGDLGQEANSSITTTHNASYSLFSNVQSAAYWSGTEDSATTTNAWDFITFFGIQSNANKVIDFYALAVSTGDVSAVPEPGAAWLLGVGVLGLLGLVIASRRASRFGNSRDLALIGGCRGR